ncbi:MAG: electron transfer flavoprotein subunit alpha, partial [Deltaproteobacteria bacterium]|nr:electron transfer flavoprotein subunit alpha [Deltaproteobacteria bacterium]
MEKQHIGVFVEHRGGVLHNVSLELIGKARELADISKGTVSVFLLGRDISGFSDDLIAHGADRVLLADSPILEPYRLLSYTFVLAQ